MYAQSFLKAIKCHDWWSRVCFIHLLWIIISMVWLYGKSRSYSQWMMLMLMMLLMMFPPPRLLWIFVFSFVVSIVADTDSAILTVLFSMTTPSVVVAFVLSPATYNPSSIFIFLLLLWFLLMFFLFFSFSICRCILPLQYHPLFLVLLYLPLLSNPSTLTPPSLSPPPPPPLYSCFCC